MNDRPLSELLEETHPDHVTLLKGMAAQAAVPLGGTLNDLRKAYIGTELGKKASLEEWQALMKLVKIEQHPPGKFAQKLTFQERCQILALHRLGTSRNQLAKMFHIDRKTVS